MKSPFITKEMSRDFTYIDDAVNFTIKLIDMIQKKIPHEV